MPFDGSHYYQPEGFPDISKPPWHSRNRLDIRPVLWSLRNRPQEWRRGNYTLDHIPSGHRFWIANGFFHYSLYEANGCSCRRENHDGHFSLIQKIEFGAAYKAWRKSREPDRAQINAQFASHFILPLNSPASPGKGE